MYGTLPEGPPLDRCCAFHGRWISCLKTLRRGMTRFLYPPSADSGPSFKSIDPIANVIAHYTLCAAYLTQGRTFGSNLPKTCHGESPAPICSTTCPILAQRGACTSVSPSHSHPDGHASRQGEAANSSGLIAPILRVARPWERKRCSKGPGTTWRNCQRATAGARNTCMRRTRTCELRRLRALGKKRSPLLLELHR